MIETSADVLRIVAAVSIGLVAVFFCLLMFYVIGTIRNVLAITRDARKIFDKIESILDAIKDKIHSSTSYLMIIGEVLKKMFEFMNKNEGKFSLPKFGRKKKAKTKKDENEDEEDSEEEDLE